MYAFGPLSLTRNVMSKNRKYVQGGGKGTPEGEALFSREQVKHLPGLSLLLKWVAFRSCQVAAKYVDSVTDGILIGGETGGT